MLSSTKQLEAELENGVAYKKNVYLLSFFVIIEGWGEGGMGKFHIIIPFFNSFQ